MPPIRVLVADDSITVRKRMIAVLSADPELEVIAEAADGRTATEMCRRLRPDVMTMDVMMPVMDGVSATEYIMANCPTSILVVSSPSHRGEVLQTFDALAAGAVDALDKPAGIEPRSVWEGELVSAVKTASRIRPITRTPVRGQTRGLKPAAVIVADAAPEFIHGDASIIAIGTSTGGPAAIAKVLSQIPADFPLSILLVIHIAPEFADGLLQWIAKLSKMPVRVAIERRRTASAARPWQCSHGRARSASAGRGRLSARHRLCGASFVSSLGRRAVRVRRARMRTAGDSLPAHRDGQRRRPRAARRPAQRRPDDSAG